MSNNFTSADIEAMGHGDLLRPRRPADNPFRTGNPNAEAPSKPRQSKYGAQPISIDGHRFPSQKEGRFYGQLKQQLQAGTIMGFCLQPRFGLPGGIWYVADFVVWMPPETNVQAYANIGGPVRVIDVKGIKTPAYKLKKRLMREIHHIEIEEV